jgi:hypothetical protein
LGKETFNLICDKFRAVVAAMGAGYAKKVAGELKLMEELAGLLKEYRGAEL